MIIWEAFIEVFKYALKFSEMSHFDIWLAHETLSPDGRFKTLTSSIGLFRGVKVPEKMTDEQLSDDLPFYAGTLSFYSWCWLFCS